MKIGRKEKRSSSSKPHAVFVQQPSKKHKRKKKEKGEKLKIKSGGGGFRGVEERGY